MGSPAFKFNVQLSRLRIAVESGELIHRPLKVWDVQSTQNFEEVKLAHARSPNGAFRGIIRLPDRKSVV